MAAVWAYVCLRPSVSFAQGRTPHRWPERLQSATAVHPAPARLQSQMCCWLSQQRVKKSWLCSSSSQPQSRTTVVDVLLVCVCMCVCACVCVCVCARVCKEMFFQDHWEDAGMPAVLQYMRANTGLQLPSYWPHDWWCFMISCEFDLYAPHTCILNIYKPSLYI